MTGDTGNAQHYLLVLYFQNVLDLFEVRQISQCLYCIFLSWTASRRMTFCYLWFASPPRRGAQRLRSFRVALRCEWQGGTLLA